MRAALERHGITLERGRYGATWTTDATRRAEDLARGRSWLEDARPTDRRHLRHRGRQHRRGRRHPPWEATPPASPTSPSCSRSEEHTSELQSRGHLVCRLLLEKKKK